MELELFACQQFAVVSPRAVAVTGGEAWQLAAGLEAILILVLFLGWLDAVSGTAERRDEDREAPQ
jgi:hypothetical protein